MPGRAAKICPGVGKGCSKILEPGERRCPAHTKEHDWAGVSGRSRSRHIPEAVRLKVFSRDRWKCQLGEVNCEYSGNIVDHVVSVGEGGSDDLSNLQTACAPCHKRKTAREASRARWA